MIANGNVYVRTQSMSAQQLLPVERMTDFERFEVGTKNRIGLTLKAVRRSPELPRGPSHDFVMTRPSGQ